MDSIWLAFGSWFAGGLILWSLLRGKMMAVKSGVAICVIAFASMFVFSLPTVRQFLDAYSPYLSLYVHNMFLMVAMSSILFTTLYRRWGHTRWLLRGIAGLTLGLIAALTWIYSVDLAQASSTPDWTQLQGPPRSGPQLVFAFTVSGYSTAVSAFTTAYNARLISKESSYLIQTRLILAVLNLSAMTAFFGLLFARALSTAIERQIPTDLLLPWLVLFSVSAIVLCILSLLPDSWLRRSPITWFLKVRDLLLLTPLQRQLGRLHPPLFLGSPGLLQKVTAPDRSLLTISVHILDMVKLLRNDERSEARALYRLFQEVGLYQEQSSAEAVLRRGKEVSQALVSRANSVQERV